MAKESGLGISVLSIDDSGGVQRAVLNDIGQFGLSTPSAEQDVTGLDKSAIERLHLLADGQLSINYFFNDAATVSIFAVLKDYRVLAAGQVGRTTTLTFSGDTMAMELLFNDFPLNRGADGSLTGQTTGMLSSGTVPTWA